MGLVVSSLLVGKLLGHFQATVDDKIFHQNRVDEGGCLKEFRRATKECHPRENINRQINVEKCAKATAALRECFAANPEKFRHLYLPRMDYNLDEDLKPSPEEIRSERTFSYRWWTGMRRS